MENLLNRFKRKKFVTNEMDISRWKFKKCNLCQNNLTSGHLKNYPGTTKDRDEIEEKTGIDAIKILEDP